MMLRREQIGRHGSAAPGIVAGLALVVALVALFLVVFRDPFGPVTQMNWKPTGAGLEGYDFSTPAGAYTGGLQVQQKGDIRAMMELQRRLENKELKEKIDTLEVKKEADLQLPETKGGSPFSDVAGQAEVAANKKDDKDVKKRDLKVLFITFLRNGERQYGVEFMEKHAESGLWKPSYGSRFAVQRVDKKLAEDIKKWEEQNDKSKKEKSKSDTKKGA